MLLSAAPHGDTLSDTGGTGFFMDERGREERGERREERGGWGTG